MTIDYSNVARSVAFRRRGNASRKPYRMAENLVYAVNVGAVVALVVWHVFN